MKVNDESASALVSFIKVLRSKGNFTVDFVVVIVYYEKSIPDHAIVIYYPHKGFIDFSTVIIGTLQVLYNRLKGKYD